MKIDIVKTDIYGTQGFCSCCDGLRGIWKALGLNIKLKLINSSLQLLYPLHSTQWHKYVTLIGFQGLWIFCFFLLYVPLGGTHTWHITGIDLNIL